MSIFKKWVDTLKYVQFSSFLKSIFAKLLINKSSKLFFSSKIRPYGRIIASSYDLIAIFFAWILACLILIDTAFGASMTEIGKNNYTTGVFALIILHWRFIFLGLASIALPQIVLFKVFGLYRGFWRFASIQELNKIISVSILGGIVAWVFLKIQASVLIQSHTLLFSPHAVALFYSIFLAIFLSSARLFVRLTKDYKNHLGDYQRVIIIGAGNAGEGLVRDLLRDETHRYKPVAFLDDDLRKSGREIHNIRVVGTIAELPFYIEKFSISLVLIAIPSASSASMRSVVDICEQAKVRCYTLPGIKDLANGYVSINFLRHVSLEDLLGRYPVVYQQDSLRPHLKNKTILVTGGAGSIGSELCRQIVLLGEVAQLIIIDSNEYSLYLIDMELSKHFSSDRYKSILLNVTDRAGLKTVLEQYRPQMVFHVAAYKHVPMLESQPRVAMQNNIIGTRILAEEAVSVGVEAFVLISSDKAVNPTNIMGATKRAAEYFCQNLNDEKHQTRFITVRFGNVLDSAGSVIPLFRKQIESGGPITVTHPDITRYFMTIPEASQLILQAAFLGVGGEIFVLDMGDPIKIRYLAEQMIKLSGKIVDKDIKIIYTGLRPGEKLYEECFYSNELLQPTINAKILRAQSQRRDFKEIHLICDEIERSCKLAHVEKSILIDLLKKLVPEYSNDDYFGFGSHSQIRNKKEKQETIEKTI